MNVWGNKLKISIFGESHGNGIGAVVDGIPSGLKLDEEFIRREMQRRAPGRDKFSTPRKEADEVEILSGVVDGYTTGTPICGIIRNTNTRSRDYHKELIRPGHADCTGFARYGETHDFRGGGHFSGRITAALVFAGALAKLALREKGVTIASHIKSIGSVCEKSFLDFESIDEKLLCGLTEKAFPVIEDECGEGMKKVITEAAADKNSVGGIIECAAIGVKPGVGAPFFAPLESLISSIMFSIPAVKGIEFGDGFGSASLRGSQNNDPYDTDGVRIFTKTNHAGGILGGMTTGMPLIFRAAMKPTPSIFKEQDSVDMVSMKPVKLSIKGRHDPCIVLRAVPVFEAAAAIAVYDLLADSPAQ